jgi:hypothetical protein
MIDWPTSLIEELAARRTVLFLGAGSSAGASRIAQTGVTEHPPGWKKFLTDLVASAKKGSTEDLSMAESLIAESRLLDAAEILRSCIQDADYTRCIRNTFKDYKNSVLHEAINAIDQKVVITTNYDCIYENFCRQGDGADGYHVIKYHDEGLVASLRSPTRLILKAHGCMQSADRTVLTKSEYFGARQNYGSFFQTLESLFTTNTLLFIGYSLADPDIQLLLENSAITAKSIHPHYATMPIGTHNSIKASFRKIYNVEILEYDSSNGHEELSNSLISLANAVNEARAPMG